MRLTKILAGAVAFAATITVSVVVPASAATAIEYAALGDSYSSGVGTGDYYSNSGSCDRSPESYAALWDAAHSVSNFDFAACSGAKTTDVLNSQLGGLSASTNLITMNIGGNDAGFSSVMTTCVEDTIFGDSGCLNAVNNAETFVRNNAARPAGHALRQDQVGRAKRPCDHPWLPRVLPGSGLVLGRP